MDPRTKERVERWDSRPFTDGYDGLSALASNDFSGAVAVDGTWLFVLNGRIVGVIDGSIEDAESTTGTVYRAPDPVLPLLCSMEETGGETRAKYYTNETSLEDVDETLTSGSFTGYVELSEQVLSGDYYLVYYGGRRMAAAYIGNAERLLTGEEAFERAADEVGIYEVIDVDVEVTDVPGTSSESDGDPQGAASASEDDSPDGVRSGSPAGASAAEGTADRHGGDTRDQAADTDAVTETDESGDAASSVDAGSAEASDGPADVPPTADAADAIADERTSDSGGITTSETPADEPVSTGITDADPEEPTGDERGSDPESADRSAAVEERTVSPSSAGGPPNPADGSASTGDGNPDPDDLEAAAEELTENGVPWADAGDGSDAGVDAEGGSTDGADGEDGSSDDESDLEERFKQEERWRETRSIPSIDPDNSDAAARSRARQRRARGRSSANAAETAAQQERRRAERAGTQRANEAPSTEAAGTAADAGDSESAGTAGSTDSGGDDSETLDADMLEREDEIDRLRQRIDTLEDARDELASTNESLEAERDRLRAENDDLSATVERLESRIEELEAELEGVRAGDAVDVGAAGGTQLAPQRALAQTNLFVRYGSKSQPTLASAHDGEADANAVGANLRLEHHTQFDDADVVVDGDPYATFLEETMEYRFVDWLTGTLLYEIRDTDHANGLADLYDVLPLIDRAEFQASISLAEDDTDDVPDSVTFDVVAFDKRGTPLIVANLNDSRGPATEEMLTDLEETASAVNANYPELGAAFVVTSSFFDPGALEVVEQATSAGFLSRGSKLSFVNLSRKQGYHLCLVESRGDEFHMNVPEL